MKICIRNEQDKLKVGFKIRKIVKKAIKNSLSYMNFTNKAEISVMFVDDEEIKELNKIHRNIDSSTDVLSFPMFEFDEEGKIIEEFADYNKKGELVLGDIVISLEHAKKQSVEFGHSFEREVGFLTVHSMLHLLGYDHMEEDEEKEMFSYQEKILNEMGLLR